MKVLYDHSFPNMVKACILKATRGYEPTTEYSSDCVNSSDFSMNELLVEWNWLNGTPHNIKALSKAVNLASRYRFFKPELLFNVIEEALKYGVDYVLTRSSSNSKRFCNMILSVRRELRDAKLSIKFSRHGNTLFGKYFFSHNIADLLLDFYEKRFPDKQVVIADATSSAILSVAKPEIPAPEVLSGVPASPVTLNSFL